MTQGDTLASIAYGIEILLIICELRATHSYAMQPWYADNAGAGGMFDALQEHMREMMVQRPPQGNLPGLTKSILVIYPWNVQRAEAYFSGIGVSVVAGSHYLSGFIGDPNSEKACLDDTVKEWTN